MITRINPCSLYQRSNGYLYTVFRDRMTCDRSQSDKAQVGLDILPAYILMEMIEIADFSKEDLNRLICSKRLKKLVRHKSIRPIIESRKSECKILPDFNMLGDFRISLSLTRAHINTIINYVNEPFYGIYFRGLDLDLDVISGMKIQLSLINPEIPEKNHMITIFPRNKELVDGKITIRDIFMAILRNNEMGSEEYRKLNTYFYYRKIEQDANEPDIFRAIVDNY